MDYEIIKTGFLAVNILLTIGMWLSNNRDKKDLATVASINRVESRFNEKIQAQEVAIAQIKQELTHSVTVDDLEKIYREINETKACMNTQTGELRHINKSLDSLTTWARTAKL
jgi:hypothetical protein